MMLRTILNYFSFVVAGALLLAAALIIQVWPASWWLDVRSVRVFDSQVGQPVVMAVDRTISRNFRGEWIASIRALETGKWVPFCVARGASHYRTDSVYPDPLSLRWWTYPSCNPLPSGKYVMHTTWVIKGDSFMPDKVVEADSNIFVITP